MRILLSVWAVVVAGCAATAPAPVQETAAPTRIEAASPATGMAAAGGYVVKKGDTLYSIALDHGVDVRELAVWNGLDNPNRIRLGQKLRVTSPDSGKPAVISEGAAEIRPVSAAGAPVVRPLEPAMEKPAPGAVPASGHSIPPATVFPADSETLKRSPKGGKLPYSEENLARLRTAETAPAPVPVTLPPAVAPAAADKPPLTPAAVPVPAGELVWAWPAPGKPVTGFGDSNKGLDFAGRIGDPVLAAAPGKVIHVGSEIRGLGNFVVVKHNAEFLSVYANNSRVLVKQDQQVTRGQKIAELGNSDADQPKLHFEIRQQGKPVDPLRYLPPR